jgi:hypothetical protein
MTWFDVIRRDARRLLGAGLIAGLLSVLVACGGGSDSESDDDQNIVATVSPAGPTPSPVVEQDDTVEPTPSWTTAPEATNTPEPTATATASPTPVPPTATPTIVPTPTATPLPTVDEPFDEAISVVDVVTNFTLMHSARFEGDDGQGETVELLIEQASPESYHLKVSSSGQQTEAWRAGDVIYVLGPGGTIVELPGLVDQNLYAPSSFLFLVPNLDQIGVATVLDERADVGGRQATHYDLDPASALAYGPTELESAENVEGTFEVWVDNQLNMVLRISADVSWDVSGNRQSMQMEFLISDIDATPEIQPPV